MIVAERGDTTNWFPISVPNPITKSIFPPWHTIQYFPSGISTVTGSVRAFNTTIVFIHASPHGFPFRRKATTFLACTGRNSKCSFIKLVSPIWKAGCALRIAISPR